MATITSANAVYMLMVTDLFPVPQQLQGFAADDAFTTDAMSPAEVMMGVDGRLSAGYTPVPITQTVSLAADSTSATLFDAWVAAQKAAREVYFANGLIRLSSIGMSYTLVNGVLTSIPMIASAKKVLQSRSFVITWESVTGAPI